MSFSQFTEDDHRLVKQAYKSLDELAIRRCRDKAEVELVHKAFDFANSAHMNIRRRSGEPYILHPIEVDTSVIHAEIDDHIGGIVGVRHSGADHAAGLCAL